MKLRNSRNAKNATTPVKPAQVLFLIIVNLVEFKNKEKYQNENVFAKKVILSKIMVAKNQNIKMK